MAVRWSEWENTTAIQKFRLLRRSPFPNEHHYILFILLILSCSCRFFMIGQDEQD
jgi:hypothetical protein